MRRDKLISYIVSVAVAVVMALTAVAVSAAAGRGDAYIGVETESGQTDPAGSASGTDSGTPETSAPLSEAPATPPPAVTSDDSAPETYDTEDTGDGETAGVPDETHDPSDETTRGASGALGGLEWDSPQESTSFETSIVVIGDTTDTDMEDTETEPTPPEPETPPDVTDPPQTEPSVTDQPEIDPAQPEIEPIPPEVAAVHEPSVVNCFTHG